MAWFVAVPSGFFPKNVSRAATHPVMAVGGEKGVIIRGLLMVPSKKCVELHSELDEHQSEGHLAMQNNSPYARTLNLHSRTST